MAPVASPSLQELADLNAIALVRARYCRGIDRCDVALLRSVFWSDAIVHYGIYNGSATEFADLTVRTVRDSCQATMHLIANASVGLQAERAVGETYVVAYHSIKSIRSIGVLLDDPALAPFKSELIAQEMPCSFVVGGRYLDRFERRDGEWRIKERAYVWDWCEQGPPNLLFRAINSGTHLLVGSRDGSDESYTFLSPA